MAELATTPNNLESEREQRAKTEFEFNERAKDRRFFRYVVGGLREFQRQNPSIELTSEPVISDIRQVLSQYRSSHLDNVERRLSRPFQEFNNDFGLNIDGRHSECLEYARGLYAISIILDYFCTLKPHQDLNVRWMLQEVNIGLLSIALDLLEVVAKQRDALKEIQNNQTLALNDNQKSERFHDLENVVKRSFYYIRHYERFINSKPVQEVISAYISSGDDKVIGTFLHLSLLDLEKLNGELDNLHNFTRAIFACSQNETAIRELANACGKPPFDAISADSSFDLKKLRVHLDTYFKHTRLLPAYSYREFTPDQKDIVDCLTNFDSTAEQQDYMRDFFASAAEKREDTWANYERLLKGPIIVPDGGIYSSPKTDTNSLNVTVRPRSYGTMFIVSTRTPQSGSVGFIAEIPPEVTHQELIHVANDFSENATVTSLFGESGTALNVLAPEWIRLRALQRNPLMLTAVIGADITPKDSWFSNDLFDFSALKVFKNRHEISEKEIGTHLNICSLKLDHPDLFEG